MEDKPLSTMIVEEAFEFVSSELCLPELAEKLKGNLWINCMFQNLSKLNLKGI